LFWHKTDAMLAEYVREGWLFDVNASEGIRAEGTRLPHPNHK
jgi:hypothetical protein